MTNEVLQAIAGRNSCRDFTGEPLTDAQVNALVDAALAAPSAMNAMPWHIIVITDKKLLDELDKACIDHIAATDPDTHARMKDRGGKVFYNAPCLIVIAKNNSGWATLDAGIVSQNIALAAHSMELGNVICGLARLGFEGEAGKEWTKRIQMPDGYTFAMSVCIGRANKGKDPHELNRDKVTYIN
ncbi:MAG: nitroreductase family protein [Defluviitaleaceae bacterium]|nr:nitroreductase family protein [Defluviitaleaceae bacterium]